MQKTNGPRVAAAARAERVPPQSLEAEMSLLGSMCLEREAIGLVIPVMNRSESRWLYHPEHRLLFEFLIDLYDERKPIDLVIVRDELKRLGLLDKVGGVEYVVRLVESVPSWVNAEHYAKVVRDKGLLRDLIRCVGEIGDAAYTEAEPTDVLLDIAEQKLFGVTERRVSGRAILLREPLEKVYKQIEQREGHYLTGLPSGFTELDDLTGGFQPGDLIVIAGRPSMGKTAFGLGVADHVAVEERRPVAFFSMEMNVEQIAMRILCARGGVDSHHIRRGTLSEEQINRLGYVCAQLQDAPMLIDDTPGMSILELRAKTRRVAQQNELAAVFVDYLQLMHCPGVENRQQEIATISRGLKGLARELKVPVIAMAQLNRASEEHEEKRPRMSNLRESGAIEQDADVVILLHRPEYYAPNDPELRGIAEVIIAKQRNGPTGTINLQFSHSQTRFANLAVVADPGRAAAAYDAPDDFGAPF